MKSVVLGWCDKTVDFLQAALYFVVFFLPLMILFLLGCFFAIVRPVVGLVLRRKHGEKIVFLQGLDAMCAIDCEVDPMNVTGVLTLKGRVDMNRTRDIILRNVVEARDSTGRLLYPTLRYYIISELGYYFWLKERRFRIEDHVLLNPGPAPKNDFELGEILGKICNRQMEAGKSPWQFILIPLSDDFQGLGSGPRYCFVLSFLHAMADGVSLVQLITTHLFEEPYNESLPVFKKNHHQSFLNLFFSTVKVMFYLPRALAKQVMINDRNALHGPRLSGRKFVGFSTPIPLDRIQRLRKLTSTSINDILMSFVAGAVRSYFLAVGNSSPPEVTAVVPVSKHGFSKDELKNSCSFVPYKLPVHLSDPIERLKVAQDRMNHLKVSPNLWFDFYGFQFLINRLPKFFSRLYLNSLRITSIVSNVPGSKYCYSMCGKHVVETAAFLLPNRGRVGVGISVLSYNSNIQVGIILDKNVTTRTDAVHVILTSFNKEVELLEKATEFKDKK